MPQKRDKDRKDEELDDEELDEEEDERDPDDDEDDDERASDDDDEEEEEEPPPKKRRSRRASASSRKKRAERKKVVASNEDDDDEDEDEDEEEEEERPRRRASSKQTSSRRRSERRTDRRSTSSRRRSRRAEPEEEPPAKRSSKKRGTTRSPKRRRREKKETDLSLEIVEPSSPPEADIDLGAEIDPTWEPGIRAGGGLGLAAVAFAVGALMTAGSGVSTLSIVGLVLLLVAIAAGSIGVLQRMTRGYILALGSTGLGVVGGLLWSLYAVVSTDHSPLWPLLFFLCNLGAVISLFQMRWGPGPLADERDRLRSIKLKTANYTTVSGELALAGSFAAVLGSVLCGLLLMGAANDSGGGSSSSTAARFVEGMDLETLDSAPDTGSIVLARWGNEDFFFLGRVQEQRGDDEFHISYLDGDRAWVRLQDLRRDTLADGASVHVHVQGHDGWLPAVVTQRSGNRIEADVGEQRVWVPLAMVRVREAR